MKLYYIEFRDYIPECISGSGAICPSIDFQPRLVSFQYPTKPLPI